MSLEDKEVEYVLQGIANRFGYNFQEYSRASMKRRLQHVLRKFDLSSLSELQKTINRNGQFFQQLLPELTVPTTEMFRDPLFFKKLVSEIFPILRTYPSLRIWHAGCSTGQEVYSLAIILKEEGLYEKATIYATDINPQALETAKRGIYDISLAKEYTNAYYAAGRVGAFSAYYESGYDAFKFTDDLKQNVTFASHNLLADSVFAQMQLILCRNVMIYFDRNSQARAIKLFYDSLGYKGFLCLGTKERLIYDDDVRMFDEYVHDQRIYRARDKDVTDL